MGAIVNILLWPIRAVLWVFSISRRLIGIFTTISAVISVLGFLLPIIVVVAIVGAILWLFVL